MTRSKGRNITTVNIDRAVGKSGGPQSDLIMKLSSMGVFSAGSRIIQRVNDAQALRQSVVSGAVDIVANDVGKVRFRLIREQPHVIEIVAASDHDWARRLALRPNAHQTWVRFWMQAISQYAIRQEVVIYRRRRNRSDTAPALVVLQHSEWTQTTDGDQFFYDVSANTEGRVTMLGFASGRISSSDVIYFNGRSHNGHEGVSTLAIGADILGLSSMMMEFQAAIVKGGTRPTGFISLPGGFADDADFERFRKQVTATIKSAAEAGEPLVLSEDAKFESIGLDASAADLVNAKQQLARDTARLFRMPGHKLGLTEDLNRANLEAMEKAYVDDTLVPICEVVEQEMTASLLSEEEILSGLRFQFDREQLYDRDPAARRERIENQFKEGITFLNEARRDLGKEPVPEDQDHRRMPVNSGMVYRNGEVQILTHDKRDASDAGDTAPVASPEPQKAFPPQRIDVTVKAPDAQMQAPIIVNIPKPGKKTIIMSKNSEGSLVAEVTEAH